MIPLYRPRKLRGKYMARALEHPATGPITEELRQALADKFDYPPECVVLANSATACFEALCRWRQHEPWHMTEPCWPLFWEHRSRGLDKIEHWQLITQIGGELRLKYSWEDRAEPKVLDFSHSWEVPELTSEYCASFGSVAPIKLFCGASAGVMLVNARDLAAWLQTSIDYGFGGHGKTRDWLYCQLDEARRDNLSDVHAALALEALEHLDEDKGLFDQVWREMAREVVLEGPGGWGEYGGVRVWGEDSPLHSLLQVRVMRPGGRQYPVPELRRELAEAGIASGHQFPFEEETKKGTGQKWMWTTVPCNPNMTKEERRHVVLTLVKLARRTS